MILPNLSFHIITAKNGSPTVKGKTPEGKEFIWHSAYDPEKESARKIDIIDFKAVDGVILFGLGLGYDLVALINRLNPSQSVYVIEPFSALFTLFQEYNAPVFEALKKRVVFIVGINPENVFAQISQNKRYAWIENQAARTLCPVYGTLLKQKFMLSNHSSKRIVLLVGKGIVAPYILKDIAMAFTRLGCDTHLLPLQTSNKELLTNAQKLQPDFVFSLDGKGLNFPWVRTLGGKRVAWFVDNPFYFLDSCDKQTILFSWDKEYVGPLIKAGYAHTHYLPLATNLDIFKPYDYVEISLECETSFVGTVGVSQKNVCAERKATFTQYDKGHQRTLDDIVASRSKVLLEGGSSPLIEFLNSAYTQEAFNERMQIEHHLDYEIGGLLRESVVRELQCFKTLLFGNEALKNFETATCLYGGTINYHEQLPALYNATEVNINVTRPQLLSTVNQRVYDISATRSFFLSDYRPALSEICPFDPQVICYQSFAQLGKKIRYFLDHPAERNDIAKELYKAVVKKHSYVDRMAKVLSVVDKIS